MPRQLNIRSDEAWSTATGLAERLGKTTTDVVVEALREYQASRRIPSTKVTAAEAAENARSIMERVRKTNRRRIPGLTSDTSDLYDDDGLPR